MRERDRERERLLEQEREREWERVSDSGREISTADFIFMTDKPQ